MKRGKQTVKKPPKSYHHGDLRAALIRLGREGLERSGREGLSLRALAQQAGVSKTAPYRHFPTRNDLIAALTEEGFRQFADRLAAVNAAPLPVDDILERLGWNPSPLVTHPVK